jgi:hypothetical protein
MAAAAGIISEEHFAVPPTTLGPVTDFDFGGIDIATKLFTAATMEIAGFYAAIPIPSGYSSGMNRTRPRAVCDLIWTSAPF